MASVEFSDSYRIASFGYPTNYVRINYTEVQYDAANNRTQVRLDGVYIKYTGGAANSRCFGTLKFNGTTVLTMNGSPYTLTVDESYTYVSGSGNGSTVWVQHNSPSGTATLSVSLTGGTRNDDNEDVFGALYYYGSGYPVIGVRTTETKNVSLTTRTSALTVNPNGGTWNGSTASQTFSQAPTSTKTIANPTRTGYTFNGWTLTGGGSISGTTYTYGGSNGTLTAQWLINSYNVDLTAGNYIASVSGGGAHNYNSSVTVEATLASATGYTYSFDGWYNGSTKESSNNPYTFTMPASAVALTAVGTRTANSYTVHFDANNGSGTMSDQSFTYDTADNLTANAFTRTGYTYLGWSTDPDAAAPTYTDEQNVINLAPSGTVTLYAIWSLDTYQLSASTAHATVTVNRTASPIGGGSTGTIPTNATLYYNDALTISFAAATGYTIATHTVNGTDFSSGDTFTVTSAIAISVTGTANSYTVVFNPNRGTGSGTGTMANQGFTYDVAQPLTANAFTRYYTATFEANDGASAATTQDIYCTFTGWGKTASDAVQYTDQQSVSNLTAVANGIVNLFAKWSYGTLTLPSISRTGFVFQGWFDAATGGNKIGNAGDSFQLTDHATYYAQWLAVTYPLSITQSDNGCVVNVYRQASQYGGGSIGYLNNGATLYFGDTITISYSISGGYEKKQATLNGADFGSGYSGSAAIAAVNSAVAVVILVKLGAIVYINNVAYQAFIDNGSAIEGQQYEAFIDNGSSWEAF